MEITEKNKNKGLLPFIASLLLTLFQNKLSGSSNNGKGLGPSGFCYCPNCGYQEPHQRGIPCTSKKCRKCGSSMNRKG